MSVKKAALKTAIKLFKRFVSLFGARRENLIINEIIKALTVSITTNRGIIHFSGETPRWGAETLISAEPETVTWIDTFELGSVFWDIGANVGCYSLYAALRPDMRLLAFEPAAPNYYALNKNIEINRLEDRIMSFCLAFNDATCLDYLLMSGTEIGIALHSFAEATDFKGKPMLPFFKQGMIGFAIDEFIKEFNPPFPNYIKIDVDGLEDKIIQGARKTIADKRLKSILVELDTEQEEKCRNVIDFLNSEGLTLLAAQVSDSTSVYNHIFVRQQ